MSPEDKPGVNIQSHEEALKIASETLASLDPKECAQRTGGEYRNGVFRLPFIGRSCQVDFPSARIVYRDSGEEVGAREKLLIAHYLIHAKGTEPEGELISFREIPAGDFYFPVFTDTVTKPFVQMFSENHEALVSAAEDLGGESFEHGDTAVSLQAFPRVRIVFALWAADEEFPAEGQVLFDKTIPDYLPTEDITILCKTIVESLGGLAQGQ